ncbi:MAG TPA: DUF5937 family protein, partial [Gemmatimonadaceae bacterium]|nr:DUF5937 family protein [Gemmatimonadaceae bacterium]
LRSGLADELSRYWACVGAGHWARIVSVLEADIAFRAREMAVCGTGPMLNRLHAMVRYEAGAISVTAGSDSACHSRGRGWVLMPSVFTWPTVRVTTTDPWRPAMSYPARGVAEVWDGVPPVGEDALGTLLGRRRAAVLAALAVPRTTLEVAGRLSITPGAASLHLSRLHEARVVDRMRAGRYVFYVANDCGRVIINAAR